MEIRTVSEMKAHILARATEDAGFRASLIANPRLAVSAELGVEIPDEFTIFVHEDSPTSAHLSLPPSDQLTPEELAQVGGGVEMYRF
ncbi:MAG: NHLP leader peptide family RiPP precursor [Chloroflexi bacterium]|nr:NHLP leader peptide family RiPP precursor [Chloroflexota bacterium]